MLDNIIQIEETILREFIKKLHETKLYTRFTAMLPHRYRYSAFLSNNYLFNPNINRQALSDVTSFGSMTAFLHQHATKGSNTVQEAVMKGTNFLVHTFIEPYLKRPQDAPNIACGLYNTICHKLLGDNFEDETVEDIPQNINSDELREKILKILQHHEPNVSAQDFFEYLNTAFKPRFTNDDNLVWRAIDE